MPPRPYKAIFYLRNKKRKIVSFAEFPTGEIVRKSKDGDEIYRYDQDDIYDGSSMGLFGWKQAYYLTFFQGIPWAQSHKRKADWLELQKLGSAIDQNQTIRSMSTKIKQDYVMIIVIVVLVAIMMFLGGFIAGAHNPTLLSGGSIP